MFSQDTLSQIRNNNLSIVLETLRRHGDLSLSQLAEFNSSGLTTVKKCVQQAIDYGMIRESGEAESTGGRKAMRYTICPDYQYFLVLIIDNGKLLSTLYNFNFDRIYTDEIPFEMAEFMITVFNAISHAKEKYPLGTVCLAMPCVVKDGTIIDWYYNPAFIGVNIKAKIEDKFKINVIVQNDMNLTVLGESRIRNSVENIVTAQFSHNGIGVGEMVNGHVLEGSSGFAGEVGYMNLTRKDVTETAHFGRIIRNIIVCINPQIIVLYQIEKPKSLQKIIKEAVRGLPDYAIPEFIISDNYIGGIAAGFRTLVNKYGYFKKREELI